MVQNQETRASLKTNQMRKKVPVCVYWDADKSGYTIYLARHVSGLGWIDSMYLGYARDLAELRRIMNTFGYVHVCGISIDVSDNLDATPYRRVNDCDPVTQMVGVLSHC